MSELIHKLQAKFSFLTEKEIFQCNFQKAHTKIQYNSWEMYNSFSQDTLNFQYLPVSSFLKASLL